MRNGNGERDRGDGRERESEHVMNSMIRQPRPQNQHPNQTESLKTGSI